LLRGTLDGFALADLARALLPELAVIYTTGYVDVARQRALGAIYGEILEKPYRAEAMAKAVRIACASLTTAA